MNETGVLWEITMSRPAVGPAEGQTACSAGQVSYAEQVNKISPQRPPHHTPPDGRCEVCVLLHRQRKVRPLLLACHQPGAEVGGQLQGTQHTVCRWWGALCEGVAVYSALVLLLTVCWCCCPQCVGAGAHTTGVWALQAHIKMSVGAYTPLPTVSLLIQNLH